MAEELPDAPWATNAAASGALPDAPWVKPEEKKEEKSSLPDAPWTPPSKKEGEMPSVWEAFKQGASRGLADVAQTGIAMRGEKLVNKQEDSPAAKDLEWSDALSPIDKALPKLAYGMAAGSPTIAGGMMGTVAGAGVGSVVPAVGTAAGGLTGGAIGAAAGSMYQTIGPALAKNLEATPNDPDAAWNKTLEEAVASGAASGVGWALFPAKVLNGPVKNLIFQALGVQPAVSVAHKVASNAIEGDDLTKDLGSAYAQGVVGTAVPAAGHGILSTIGKGAKAVVGPKKAGLSPEEQAVRDRIVGSDENDGFAAPSANKTYTAMVDDLHPLRMLTNELETGSQFSRKGTGLPIEENPYELARLTRGSAGKAEHFLRHGTLNYSDLSKAGRSLEDVIAPVKDDIQGLDNFLVAKRSIDLNAAGIKTGVPLAEAQAVVAAGTPKYGKVANEVYQYGGQVLKYLKDSGIISDADMAKMQAANKHHVPFYRLMDKESSWSTGSLKVKDPIEAIKGSERQIIEPMESIIKNTYAFVSLAERNRTMQALEKLANKTPGGSALMVKDGSPVPSGLSSLSPKAFQPEEGKIAVFNNGERTLYHVSPDVANAVNGLDRYQMGQLEKIIAAPARTLRAGATMSPEFVARNPIRDQFAALLFSQNGYVPVWSALQGLGHLWKGGEKYQEWLKSGGPAAAMVSIDRNYINQSVMRLEEQTKLGTLKNIIKSPIEALRIASEAMENATRLGEFVKARNKGKSIMQAGMDSREVTLDFARAGNIGRAVNSAIPFWNAGVQGTDRLARAFAEKPLATTFKAVAGITLPSVALWMNNHNDPRYKEIPRWEKDIYWHLLTKDNIYRIPKPFTEGVLFGSVAERMLDAYIEQNPDAYKGVVKSISQGLLPNYLPQAIVPSVEQFANRSTFFDRPIVPRSMEGISPEQQFNQYTSEASKLAGRGIAGAQRAMGMDVNSFASPMVLDNYVKGFTGSLGSYGLSAADQVLRATGAVKDNTGKRPEKTAADYPLLRAFVSRHPSAGAQSIQDFYDEYDKRKKGNDTVKYLNKTGETEQAKAYRDSFDPMAGENIYRAINKLHQAVRSTWADRNMSPHDKRTKIDGLYENMIKLAQAGKKAFESSKKVKADELPNAPWSQ